MLRVFSLNMLRTLSYVVKRARFSDQAITSSMDGVSAPGSCGLTSLRYAHLAMDLDHSDTQALE